MCTAHVFGLSLTEQGGSALCSSPGPMEAFSQQPLLGLAFNEHHCSFCLWMIRPSRTELFLHQGLASGNSLIFGRNYKVDKGEPGTHFELRKMKQKDWISSF